jgi:hypothetical protein
MIPHHQVGEALDVDIFRFLSDLAEFDLGHATDRGLFDKGLVFLVQGVAPQRGVSRMAWLNRLSKNRRGGNEPEGDDCSCGK